MALAPGPPAPRSRGGRAGQQSWTRGVAHQRTILYTVNTRQWDAFLVGCGLTALVVFIPSLLYYGGGWVQAGFRYFLDAIPFLLPIIAAGSRTGLGMGWKLLIAAGIAVNLWTVPWVYGF